MDIQRFPKSKTKILYMGVWVLLFAISVWMYINEGRYLHLMSLRFTAAEEKFEVSVLAGEKRVQAFSGEDNTQTEQFRAQMGERESLLVRDSLPADNSVRQTELFFLYDDNAAEGTWTIMGSEGTERIDYSKTDMEHPGRL